MLIAPKRLKLCTSNFHVPEESQDITPSKFFQKREWPGSRDPLFLGALNANSSKWL